MAFYKWYLQITSLIIICKEHYKIKHLNKLYIEHLNKLFDIQMHLYKSTFIEKKIWVFTRSSSK